MKILAKNLKIAREEVLRISQEKLAKLMDSTRGRVSSYEIGKSEPSLDYMVKFQDLTNISVKDLCRIPLDKDKLGSLIAYPLKKEVVSFEDEKDTYKKELANCFAKLSKQLVQQFDKIDQRFNKIEDQLE